MLQPLDQKSCFGCGKQLIEPYICCAECLSPFCYLCLHCYAEGKEFGLHENSHPYKIVRNNFALFESHWSAAEELQLLDSVIKCGIGNWAAVSRCLGTKSKQDCKAHYFRCYIFQPHKDLPVINSIVPYTSFRPAPITYTITENPPRPSITSATYNEMAGYIASRGDFNLEFDNYAEFDLKSADFDPEADDLENELHIAALEIYNMKLKERNKRKQLIRQHGLISFKNNFIASLRYSKTLDKKVEKIYRLSRLLSADSLNFFLESLHLEHELKIKIQELQEYRAMGITHSFSIPFYKVLKKNRQEFSSSKNLAFSELLGNTKDENSLKQLLQRKIVADNYKNTMDNTIINPIRKKAARLEIAGLPNYEKLNEKERELCSTLRLVPMAYLQFRAALVNECDKLGELKLAQARTLLKIDVNKTRKVFDLLVEEGAIRKT